MSLIFSYTKLPSIIAKTNKTNNKKVLLFSLQTEKLKH